VQDKSEQLQACSIKSSREADELQRLDGSCCLASNVTDPVVFDRLINVHSRHSAHHVSVVTSGNRRVVPSQVLLAALMVVNSSI
jgi:hypothetical protein